MTARVGVAATVRRGLAASVAAAALAHAPGAEATAASATATPAAIASPAATGSPAGPLVARGRLLAIAGGYVVFETGEALRLRAGVAAPRGATLGSAIVATIDRATRETLALAVDAGTRGDAIDVADLPPGFTVGSSAAPRDVAVAVGAAASAGSGSVTIVLTVTVPANTPQGDDVYVATDRSHFSPSEVRMERTGSRRFVATLTIPAGTRLRYEFTRGSYASVERDRSGGIVEPHALVAAPGASDDETVARWADLD